MDYDLAPPFLTEHQSGIGTRGYLDLPNLQNRIGTPFSSEVSLFCVLQGSV